MTRREPSLPKTREGMRSRGKIYGAPSMLIRLSVSFARGGDSRVTPPLARLSPTNFFMRTLRGLNDLIRDTRGGFPGRLRYEADLSFSRETDRGLSSTLGNTLPPACLFTVPRFLLPAFPRANFRTNCRLSGQRAIVFYHRSHLQSRGRV